MSPGVFIVTFIAPLVCSCTLQSSCVKLFASWMHLFFAACIALVCTLLVW